MATLFTLLLGISAVLLVYALYDLGQRTYIRETGAAIDGEMALILEKINSLTPSARIPFLKKRAGQTERSPIFYYHENGSLLFSTQPTSPQQVQPITEGLVSFTLQVDKKKHRFAGKIHTFTNGQRLLVYRDIEEISKSYTQLRWLCLLILIFIIIVVLVSFLISTFVVSRTNTIANTAKSIIETHDLSHRISINNRWDDISNLAFILNQLLDRVESLVHAVKDAGHSIAHDLRTPLTRLKAHLDQAQSQAQSKALTESLNPEVFEQLQQEVDKILELFNTLLRIGRLESGNPLSKPQSVDLQQVLTDVIELYEPVAEAKQIPIKFQIQTTTQTPQGHEINGDRNLLFQIFSNLIDNAIKFTPNRGCIYIDMLIVKQKIEVWVTDTGVGVSPECLKRLCDRFFRADTSRSTDGSGLGLSLVRAGVDWHQGELTLSSPGHRSFGRHFVSDDNQNHDNQNDHNHYGFTAILSLNRMPH